MSIIKAVLILVGINVLLLLLGDLFPGHFGLYVALVLVILLDLYTCVAPTRVILNVLHARPADKKIDSDLAPIVTELADKLDLPVPTLYCIDSDAVNILVVGYRVKSAKIVVTRGLLKTLTPPELKAVLAQAIGRLERGDLFLGAMTAVLANMIIGLANMAAWANLFSLQSKPVSALKQNKAVMTVFAPLAFMLMRVAVPPETIFFADGVGVVLCQETGTLISAFKKLYPAQAEQPLAEAQIAPGMAHLFIVSPLCGMLAEKFAPLPNMEERIKIISSVSQSDLEVKTA